jgi:hypothetical protein
MCFKGSFCLFALALALTGCQPSAASRPLNGTVWRITEVSGQGIAETAVLALDSPDLGLATLTTPCRREVLAFAYDTDGSAVSFAAPSTEPTDCSDEARIVDALVAQALRDATEWVTTGDQQFQIRGATSITMEESQ